MFFETESLLASLGEDAAVMKISKTGINHLYFNMKLGYFQYIGNIAVLKKKRTLLNQDLVIFSADIHIFTFSKGLLGNSRSAIHYRSSQMKADKLKHLTGQVQIPFQLNSDHHKAISKKYKQGCWNDLLLLLYRDRLLLDMEVLIYV